MQQLVGHSVISLFAGIGGFDLGFQRTGFRIVAHVEKDENCRKLLSAKWPDAVALDDVCTAGAHNLPPCDVVTFGFPCQDLSVAGKRAGLAGGRSGLFYEATRIINELKPSYCLFENVPGLLSSDEGRDFARVLMEMDRIGYCGAWRVLDAQWLGVAQRRRRVFGLFTRLDSGAERCAEILSLPESLRGHPAPSREAGEGTTHIVAPCIGASGRGFERTGETRGQDPVVAVPAVAGCCSSKWAKGSGGPAGDEVQNLVPAVAVPVATPWDGQRARIHDANGTAPTLPNQRIPTIAVHNYQFAQIRMQVRRLTPRECSRLQGFPDDWLDGLGFSDSTRYKMFGNAVCVNVAEWIAGRMANKGIAA